MPRLSGLLLIVFCACFVYAVGCGQESDPPSEQVGATAAAQADEAEAKMPPPPPEHLAHPPSDPRVAISAALDAGLFEVHQASNDRLAALLESAGVAQASQVLVFSKTSLQHHKISPANPRAIYFNDDCYIGYVPGGLIEYGDADPDPDIGSGLFSLEIDDNDAALRPDTSCLSCHKGSRTDSKPGLLVRSVFPDPSGNVITSAGSTTVGHDTPLEKRWGGWYVTGESGSAHHRGNQVALEQPNGDASIDNELGSNLNDLSRRFNTKRYLQPTSDIVALMVLEHQVQMHNALTQGSMAVHAQEKRSRELAEYYGKPFDAANADTLQRVITSNARKIVEQMLFCDEVGLVDPVVGSEAYERAFRANRKEDDQGRSLKDFDLETRMFKHRCSYMVYSRAFELMHPLLKEAVAKKLKAVLSGEDGDPVYKHLGDKERRAILEILTQTTDLF